VGEVRETENTNAGVLRFAQNDKRFDVMEGREIRKATRKKVAKRGGGVIHLKLRYQIRARQTAARFAFGSYFLSTSREQEDYYVEPSAFADRDLL
jgi:hypothetical protein